MARSLPPSSGTGKFALDTIKSIRLHRHGCTNRPFYHVVVSETIHDRRECPIEQLGTYDPMPNSRNEKLVSLNFERIKHWIGYGAVISDPARQVLGLAGFFPIHPTSYMKAWRNRQAAEKKQLEEQAQPTAEPKVE